MRPDGLGRGGRIEFRVRYVESGLGGAVPQPCCGTPGKDPALDLDNRLDVRKPLGIDQLAGRIEDGDDPRLIAVAAFVVTVVEPERRRGLRDGLDLLI